MDNNKLLELMAQADADAKGWETNRKGTTENGMRYVRQDIALEAMRLTYALGVSDCRASHPDSWGEKIDEIEDAAPIIGAGELAR